METNLLNEYVFTQILREHAVIQRDIRRLSTEPTDSTYDRLIEQDFHLGFEQLQLCRDLSLQVLAASISDKSK